MEQRKKQTKRLQWHPAFCNAMQLDFAEDAFHLTFQNEYALGTKPLNIDLLIIDKDDATPIHNPIGRIFRRHNIIEYKSPGKPLNLQVLYKAYSYAYLYLSKLPSGEARTLDDISLTLIRQERAAKLLNQLSRSTTPAVEVSPGIYQLQNVPFAVQIVAAEQVPAPHGKWLKRLTRNVSPDDLDEACEDLTGTSNPVQQELMSTMINFMLQANLALMEENYMSELQKLLNTVGINMVPQMDFDAAMAENAKKVAERDSALAERDSALAAKDSALAERDLALAESAAIIADLQRQIAVLKAQQAATLAEEPATYNVTK